MPDSHVLNEMEYWFHSQEGTTFLIERVLIMLSFQHYGHIPDSIKVALGIGQLGIGKLLFAVTQAKHCIVFRMPKCPMSNYQCPIAKATFIELGIYIVQSLDGFRCMHNAQSHKDSK